MAELYPLLVPVKTFIFRPSSDCYITPITVRPQLQETRRLREAVEEEKNTALIWVFSKPGQRPLRILELFTSKKIQSYLGKIQSYL